jgi:pimeloyl-ACP methyl ester carboxylesterase
MSSWVLLRGLTREARHWGEFPAMLSRELGGCPVLTMDLPGNGALHRLRSPGSVEAMADCCHAELRRGLAGPVNVLAMSLGAMVAVAWAQRHPRDLAGIVLVNTSLKPVSPFHQRLRPRNYAALLALALAGTPRQWEQTILRLTSRQTGDRSALLQRWLMLRAERPVSRANALRQLWAAAR